MIEEHIAGDPMNTEVRWLKLTRAEISEKMRSLGVRVGRHVVRRLLKKHGFVKRKLQRKRACGQHADREQQFQIIEMKKAEFEANKHPVISIDTKKKEAMGTLHREGVVDCNQAIEVFDHDYRYLSSGKIVPHGIFDLANNKGHIHLGLSAETADFICDSIALWWENHGRQTWPEATEILILCDAGGANSYRHHLFKVALQGLANRISVVLRISHYPPYASKWNPIEHRVFPHVTRVMSGTPLLSQEDAREKIEKASTKTGLQVTCDILDKTYETEKRATKAVLDYLNLKADEVLGKFNYTLSPQKAKCPSYF